MGSTVFTFHQIWLFQRGASFRHHKHGTMVHSKILLHLTRNDDIDASVKTVPFLSFTWVLIGLRSFAWVISAISIVWRMELVTSFDGKLQCSNYLHYIVFRRRVGWSMCHTQCWSQCSTKRFSPIFLLNSEEHNINRKQGHNTISVLNTSKDFILWSLVTPLKTDTESQDHLLSQHFGNQFQLVAFLGFNMWEYRVSTADRWFVDSQVRDMASALRLELDTRRRKVDEVL